jgi:hypothetical protein
VVLIDLTDQVLLIGRMIGSGPTSGAASESEWAELLSVPTTPSEHNS